MKEKLENAKKKAILMAGDEEIGLRTEEWTDRLNREGLCHVNNQVFRLYLLKGGAVAQSCAPEHPATQNRNNYVQERMFYSTGV